MLLRSNDLDKKNTKREHRAKLRDSPLKGVREPKPIQNQVSTIHFLFDSLNK